MRVLSAVVAAVVALSALAAGQSVNDAADKSELVLVIAMTRHGSRAPNPTVKKYCPNNMDNLKAYKVPPEQLTERGMQQLEAMGGHIRDVYVTEKGFLSPSFNGRGDELHFESYFRADAANRCGQSAVALGYGLYPDGTGPKGYAKQPIPVYMQLPESEHDFTANVPCWKVMSGNNRRYIESRAKNLIEDHKKTLEAAAAVCGSDFYHSSDPVLAVKDVSDMMLFDRDEGLPMMEGLSTEVVKELSELAFQNLIERLYSTPRDITTAIGGFPQLLLNNLNQGADPTRNPETAIKFYSYHCHRELLHGLGFMMGFRFKFDGLPAYNDTTALIPGTSLFFELHRASSTVNSAAFEYFIRFFVWTPKTERTQVKLDNCALDCPLPEFNQIISQHIQSTGTWQDICSYHQTQLAAQPAPEANNINSVKTPGETVDPATESGSSWIVLVVGSSAVVATVCVKLYQRFKRREYLEL